MKVMVLGGYGNFGARICRALAGSAGITLLVAGRDGVQAAALAASLDHGQGVAVDTRSGDLAQVLRSHGVGLVIHTAGPFQGQDYAVARACAQAAAHYIDLADGRRFVCDFSAALQATFVAADRVAITGASTVPALSSAVVNALCADWQHVDAIDMCIAPAQTAQVGVGTLRAVLSYCGAPIQVWNAGQWQTRLGWANPQWVSFQRLRPRLASLCDIPDLELFPAQYRVRDRMVFGAALEVGFAQCAFAMLAWLRKVGVIDTPSALAGVLNAGARLLDPLGSQLGGMVVRVAGRNAQGAPAQRAWHIAADNSHGPEIPCMPAILLARRLAQGEAMASGAYPCVGLHALADFAPEFAKWGMVTDVVTCKLYPHHRQTSKENSMTQGKFWRIGTALMAWVWVAGAGSLQAAELRVLTHSSFALPKPLLAQFEKEAGVKLRITKAGDSGEMLNKLILTRANPIADVVFGIDNVLAGKALAAQVLDTYDGPLSLAARQHGTSGEDAAALPAGLVPVDYGYVTLNYDKAWFAKRGLALPRTLEELTQPAYARLLVVQNPATSSPGNAFLLATLGAMGEEKAFDWWARMRANGVKVTKGWTEAYYTEFSHNGGAYPLVVSYASSPAAEVFFSKVKLTEPPTGSLALPGAVFRQVEGVSLVRGGKERAAALRFITFLRSAPVQQALQTEMWMFPADRTVARVEAMRFAVEPTFNHSPSTQAMAEQGQAWVTRWTKVVLK